MVRPIRLLIAFACICAGAVVGALNTRPVMLDLGVTRLHASLGVIVLAALLVGVLVGGTILAAGVVAPLRRRLRISDAALRRQRTGEPD